MSKEERMAVGVRFNSHPLGNSDRKILAKHVDKETFEPKALQRGFIQSEIKDLKDYVRDWIEGGGLEEQKSAQGGQGGGGQGGGGQGGQGGQGDFITRKELVEALRLSKDAMEEKEILNKDILYSADRLFSDKTIIDIATEIQKWLKTFDDQQETETKLTLASIAKMNNDTELKIENENKMKDNNNERETDSVRKRLLSQAFKYVFEYETIEDMINSIFVKSKTPDEKESKEQEKKPKKLAHLDNISDTITFTFEDGKSQEMEMEKARMEMDVIDVAVTSDRTLKEYKIKKVSVEEFSLIKEYVDKMRLGATKHDYGAYCNRVAERVGFGNLYWCACYLGMKRFESYLEEALSYYIWGDNMKLTISQTALDRTKEILSKHGDELIDFSFFADSISEYNEVRKRLLNVVLRWVRDDYYPRDSLLIGACVNLAKKLDNDLRLFLEPSIVEKIKFKSNKWKKFPVIRFSKAKKYSLVLVKVEVMYVPGLQNALLNALLEIGILHGYIRIEGLNVENNTINFRILVEVTEPEMKSLADVLHGVFKKTNVGTVSGDAMGWREVTCGPRFNLCILPPSITEDDKIYFEDKKIFDNSSLLLCSEDHEVHISDWLNYPLLINDTEIKDHISLKTSNSIYETLVSFVAKTQASERK